MSQRDCRRSQSQLRAHDDNPPTAMKQKALELLGVPLAGAQ
jgi:hypothetical protein